VELLARDSLRIVHVEDDDHFAGLSRQSLQLAGFTQPIVRCNDGILALHYFSTIEPESAPPVILLDLHMPHMNGLEVLHWLRHSYSEQDVAVYLLTSSEDKADKDQAAVDCATEYLLKSPLFNELIGNLDRLIGTSNNHRLAQARKMGDIMAELAFMGDHAAEMIVLLDTLGCIAWVNEPFVQASGYTSEELRGKKPGVVRQRHSDPAVVEMLHRALESVHACECRTINYKKDGTAYPAHISLGPVFDDDRLRGFLAIEKDLSAENGSDLQWHDLSLKNSNAYAPNQH
jgi:PAS domain S-box-containing protein